MSSVTRKRGRITSAQSTGRGFPPERCPKCKEAIVGVRKCKCQSGGMPRGRVWINGILRFIDGCPVCGGTLHTICNVRNPRGFIIERVPKEVR